RLARHVPLDDLGVFILLCAGLAVAGFGAALRRRRPELPWLTWLPAAAGAALGWRSVRNIALFGLAALPALVQVLAGLSSRRPRWLGAAAAAACLAIPGAGLLGRWALFYPDDLVLGLGVLPRSSAAADFFVSEGLQGPVFNDFDAAGYLIFYL